MENEIMQAKSARDITTITQEIREITRHAQTMALFYVIEIGRRLVEAKGQLQHGEWTAWLRDEVRISQSSANNYMQLFDEYGDKQISLFGAVANSQTFGNLPYSKALALLSVPAEEREAFAEEVGAEDLSVRELKQAIREREEAIKAKEEAEEREKVLEERVSIAEEAAAEARAAAEEAEQAKKEAEQLQASLDMAKAAEAEAKKQYQEALDNPKIPKKKLDEIRKDAAEKAKAAADKESKAALEAAQKAAAEAEEKLKAAVNAKVEAELDLQDARTALKKSNPDVAAFSALFEEVQKTVAALRAKIDRIAETDAGTADKLRKALAAFGATLQEGGAL